MHLVAGLGLPGYRHYFFELSEHGLIEFFEWDGVERIPANDHGVPVKGPYAFGHVALGVAGDGAQGQVPSGRYVGLGSN